MTGQGLFALAMLLSSADACPPPGGQPLIQTSAGPHAISAAAQPENPVTGTVRLIAAVCDMAGNPVPKASVTFTPINPAGIAGRPALAFTRGGRPEEYGADLTVRQPGRWRYRIHVSSTAGASETEVILEVRAPPEQPGIGPGLVFLGVVSAIAGGIAYLVIQAQKRPAGR